MKKFLTLMISVAMTLTVMAQQTRTYSGKLELSVGGMWNYTTEDDVNYIITHYTENESEKIDIVVPEYTLKNTQIGDLHVGSYTIKGLTKDAEKNGFYRNYVNDNLSVDFSSSSISAGTYALNSGTQDILVQFNEDDKTVNILNQFKVGKMPFQLTSTFTGNESSETNISRTENEAETKTVIYNLKGQVVSQMNKGEMYIVNGKKIVNN